MDDDPRAAALAHLDEIRAEVDQLSAKLKDLHAGMVAAAQAGATPSEIVRHSGASREGTRKILRDAGIPPAPKGNRTPRHAASGS